MFEKIKVMNGFILYTGEQGSGKTAMAVRSVFVERGKRPIFSNCKLFKDHDANILLDYTPIAFDVSKASNKGKLDILATLDENPNFFNDSIMLLDECHLYLDSLDFMRKNNRKLQTFFSQLRKRHILLLGTAQSLWNVDIRCRRQCLNVIQMEHSKGSLFLAETDKLSKDGNWAEFVSKYAFDLKPYYNKFDTDEVQE